jgi:hypothetical protein
LKSGAIETTFAPRYRASHMKWASGTLVYDGFPIHIRM